MVWQRLRTTYKQVPPEKLGKLGAESFSISGDSCPGYGCKLGQWTTPAGAIVPYVIEAWTTAKPSEKKGTCEATTELYVNRTRSIAPLYGFAGVGRIKLNGCGMDRQIELKSALYQGVVSIITPYVQLAGDGKEPHLPPFGDAIEEALKKACNAAYRVMDKPDTPKTIKDAAWEVMEQAYLKASGNGEYPANARQIM